jgi:hypothetical protein
LPHAEPSTVRRTAAALVLVAVATVVVIIALVIQRFWPIFFIVALYLVLLAWTAVSTSYTITPTELTFHGYIGGAVTMRRGDVAAITYVPIGPRGQNLIVFTYEIRDVRGRILRVPRFGWGRRRELLFGVLLEWSRALATDARTLSTLVISARRA